MKTPDSKKYRRITAKRVVLIAIAGILLLSAVIIGMCLFNSRPGKHSLDDYRSEFPDTKISMFRDGSVEISPAEMTSLKNTGIIFYVGAQITPDAYIPLLAHLAKNGFRCFIPKLAFNMASLSHNAALQIIQNHPETETWVLAGHSMGGLTASGFCVDFPEKVKGLILLAAYTNRNLSNTDLAVLSIFGDADGVLNRQLYEKRLSWNPSSFEEHTIHGANHAQFGDYGKQPRDNDASITPDEQQTQTAEIILNWLKDIE